LNTAICFTVYTKKNLEVYIFVYCLTLFRMKLLGWLCFCVCAGSSQCSVSGLNVFEGNNRNVMETEDNGSKVNFHFFEPLARYYFHNFSMNLWHRFGKQGDCLLLENSYHIFWSVLIIAWLCLREFECCTVR
jgi:hypothetical protein